MGGTNNNSMDYGNYNHVYSSDGYQETKIYPVAHYSFEVAYYEPGTKYDSYDDYLANNGNNDRFEPKHKYMRAKSGDRIEIRSAECSYRQRSRAARSIPSTVARPGN